MVDVVSTAIGSLTFALYQSSVPVTFASSGRRKGERNAAPKVQVSPLSLRRLGFPTTSALPVPTFHSSGLTWKSELLLPRLALMWAEHMACSCARVAGSVVSVLFRVEPGVGPGNKTVAPCGLLRQGSLGNEPNCALPLGVAYSSDMFGARSARL